jgi:hypothetical protein
MVCSCLYYSVLVHLIKLYFATLQIYFQHVLKEGQKTASIGYSPALLKTISMLKLSKVEII